jgi:hypothetical protein
MLQEILMWEVPLLHLALGDGGAAALTGATDDLLVGEHGLAGGAPVYEAALAVGEAALVHEPEEPLCPAVVTGIGGGELAAPVVGEAKLGELPGEGLNVLGGGDSGRDASLDGIVFGGSTRPRLRTGSMPRGGPRWRSPWGAPRRPSSTCSTTPP